MSLDLRFFMTMLVLFPAIAGAFRFFKADKRFRPFIYMMWLELATELVSYYSKKFPMNFNLHTATLPIYYLIYFYLFLELARHFKFVTRNKREILLISALILAFIKLIPGPIFTKYDYLQFFVSIVQLIISIEILANQVLNLKQKWNSNFWVWMSSASIFYNTIILLVFTLHSFAFPHYKSLGYLNTIINVFYFLGAGIAILKIPEGKNRYSDQSIIPNL